MTEDDKHSSSEHPQCQHKTVGLAMIYRDRLTSLHMTTVTTEYIDQSVKRTLLGDGNY